MNYIFDNEKWEIIKFREFQKSCNLELDPMLMSKLHEFMVHDHIAAWQIIRMIYGARKVGRGQDPLGRTVESFQTACKMTNLTGRQIRSVLTDAFDAFYFKETGRQPKGGRDIKFPASKTGRQPGHRYPSSAMPKDGAAVPTAAMAVVDTIDPATMQPEPEFASEDDVLNHFKFTRKIFECEGRTEQSEKQEEISWFCNRLQEIKRLFDEPMTKELARRAIMAEMLLRRIDSAMTRADVTGEGFAALQKTKSNLEDQYSAQWAQIDSIIPYASAVQSKQTFAGVVSDLVKAVERYEANHDMVLVDGIFTKYEIEIQMRQAQQHEIRYRPSLALCWADAQKHLWDANWKQTFPTRVLKLLDAGFKAGVAAVNEKGGIFLPDLESDGPGSEYEKLGEGPLGMPKEETAPADDTPAQLQGIGNDQMVPIA